MQELFVMRFWSSVGMQHFLRLTRQDPACLEEHMNPGTREDQRQQRGPCYPGWMAVFWHRWELHSQWQNESIKTVVRKWQMEVLSHGSCVLPGPVDTHTCTPPHQNKHVAWEKPERGAVSSPAYLVSVACEENCIPHLTTYFHNIKTQWKPIKTDQFETQFQSFPITNTALKNSILYSWVTFTQVSGSLRL